MICHFYIELGESNPLVWRRIVVPVNYTLYQLHLAIQGAFGWENCHLFQFCYKNLSDAIGYGVPDVLDPDSEIFDAKSTKMSKVFKSIGQQYIYIYDFGDHWVHRLTFEKIEAKEMGPYCIEGGGACPPEDVGGLRGYQEMLEAFEKPASKISREYRQWMGLVDKVEWDPEFFNIREVNKRLALLEG